MQVKTPLKFISESNLKSNTHKHIQHVVNTNSTEKKNEIKWLLVVIIVSVQLLCHFNKSQLINISRRSFGSQVNYQ